MLLWQHNRIPVASMVQIMNIAGKGKVNVSEGRVFGGKWILLNACCVWWKPLIFYITMFVCMQVHACMYLHVDNVEKFMFCGVFYHFSIKVVEVADPGGGGCIVHIYITIYPYKYGFWSALEVL